jgi:hypothetical protein
VQYGTLAKLTKNISDANTFVSEFLESLFTVTAVPADGKLFDNILKMIQDILL